MTDGMTDRRSEPTLPPVSRLRPTAADIEGGGSNGRGADANQAAKTVTLKEGRDMLTAKVGVRNAMTAALYLLAGRVPHEFNTEDQQLEDTIWSMIQQHAAKTADYSGGK